MPVAMVGLFCEVDLGKDVYDYKLFRGGGPVQVGRCLGLRWDESALSGSEMG